MKKPILLSSAILIPVASAAAFVFAARHSNSSDSLVNANIEALTNGESLQVPCVPVEGTCYTAAFDAMRQLVFITIEDMKLSEGLI